MRLLALLALLTACQRNREATWHEDVRPLVQTRCAGCHHAGGIAPFAFNDAEEARALGPAMVAAVEAGTMPPFGFDSASCRELEADGRLTEKEIAVFTRWAAHGYPEGEEQRYRAPKRPEPAVLPPPDLELTPAGPFEPDPTRSDDYLCQLMGDPLAGSTWVLGSTGVPDRSDLVHHILLYAVPPELLSTVDALDEADPQNGFRCLNGTLDNLGVIGIGGWVPGGETEIREDAAFLVPEGSRLLMEVHYNTAALPEPEPVEDFTTMQVWTLPEGQDPAIRLNVWAIGDVDLNIPPGEVHTERHTMQLPYEGWIVGSSAHMHELGVSLETQVVRESGRTDCLSTVDPWDFDWQRSYTYERPETLRLGDRIEIACTFDNTAGNQPTVNGERIEPRWVHWGDGTGDEMCLDYLVGAVPWRGHRDDGTCAGFHECYTDCNANDGRCFDRCLGEAGSTCAACALEPLLDGTCALERCPGERTRLGRCFESCVEADPINAYGCLSATCGPQWTAYKRCLEPVFQAGDCPGFAERCGRGLRP